MNIPQEFTRKLALTGVDLRIIKTAYKIYEVLNIYNLQVKTGVLSKNALKRLAGIGARNNIGLDKAIMAMLNAKIINDEWGVIWKI